MIKAPSGDVHRLSQNEIKSLAATAEAEAALDDDISRVSAETAEINEQKQKAKLDLLVANAQKNGKWIGAEARPESALADDRVSAETAEINEQEQKAKLDLLVANAQQNGRWSGQSSHTGDTK